MAENAVVPSAAPAAPLSPPALRPRVWPVFVVYFGVLIGLNVVSTVALIVYAALDQGLTAQAAEHLSPQLIQSLLQEPLERPLVMGSLTAITSLTFGGSALLFGLFGRERLGDRLRFRASSWGVVVIAAFGFFAASDVLDGLVKAYQLERFSFMLPKLNAVMEQLQGPLFPAGLLVFGLLPGICEELFFRGFIQSRLTARWGVPAGIVVTAFLFGLAHFDPVHSPITFLMGLGLGWITERTRSLWPAVAAHILNNVLCFAETTGLARFTLPSGWRFVAMLVLATSAFVLVQSGPERPAGEQPAA